MKVSLFTTLGCHLCEDAVSILLELVDELNIELVEVEIADSDELVEKYGIRIPVILKEGASEDLGWPFDSDGARRYLSAQVAR